MQLPRQNSYLNQIAADFLQIARKGVGKTGYFRLDRRRLVTALQPHQTSPMMKVGGLPKAPTPGSPVAPRPLRGPKISGRRADWRAPGPLQSDGMAKQMIREVGGGLAVNEEGSLLQTAWCCSKLRFNQPLIRW